MIKNHNQDDNGSLYKMGHNQFSTMSEAEFEMQFPKVPAEMLWNRNEVKNVNHKQTSYEERMRLFANGGVDWRNSSMVSDVKQMG